MRSSFIIAVLAFVAIVMVLAPNFVDNTGGKVVAYCLAGITLIGALLVAANDNQQDTHHH